MSDVQKTPVALLSSDWHLRPTVPASRGEADWYAVMDRRLEQVFDLQKELGGVPLVIAGDVFDTPNPYSDFALWACRRLEEGSKGPVLAIPGNHDLAGHQLSYRSRGVYGMGAGMRSFVDLEDRKWHHLYTPGGSSVALWPMPWGDYTLPTDKQMKQAEGCIKIAVVHKYMYATKDHTYVGHNEEDCVTQHTKWGKYFDVISVGDNHTPWKAGKFINHGSLFSLTSAQKDHEHLFGIVYSDGSLESRVVKEEKCWVDIEIPQTLTEATSAFLAELTAADLDSVGFDDLLDRLEGSLPEGPRRQLREIRAGK